MNRPHISFAGYVSQQLSPAPLRDYMANQHDHSAANTQTFQWHSQMASPQLYRFAYTFMDVTPNEATYPSIFVRAYFTPLNGT
jgi:hypothetical protein